MTAMKEHEDCVSADQAKGLRALGFDSEHTGALPTLHQAAKWLRHEKGLHIDVCTLIFKKKVSYEHYVGDSGGWLFSAGATTYESALSGAIDTAIAFLTKLQ